MSVEEVLPIQGSNNSERIPLLPARYPNSQRWVSKVSVESLAIPLAIAGRLAITLPITPTIDLLHQMACRRWYDAQSQRELLSSRGALDPMCSVPAVEQNFSAVIMVLTVLEAIGAMMSYSAVSFFANRYGRKPVILSILAMFLSSLIALLAAEMTSGLVNVVLLAIWIILHVGSGPPTLVLATNMYVIDLVQPQHRTAALSKITGWTVLGSAPSFMIGGIIATRSNVALVFYSAAVITVAILLYVTVALPESFPPDKRLELQLQRVRETGDAPRNTTLLEKLSVPFEPLKQFKPRRNPGTDTRNWRLAYCAMHIGIANIGDDYAAMAVVVFLSTQHGYTPADIGYVLTTFAISAAVVLTFFIPFLVRLLRPLYLKRWKSYSPTTEPRTTCTNEVVASSSDRMDIHITFVSWVIVTLAVLFAGYASTKVEVIAAIILWSLGSGRLPLSRSIVVATVDPLEQGEVLSAIEMVSGMGSVLSAVVMGGVFTATISTFPRLVFYVHGVIVMSAASLLFFIRDADRYRSPAGVPVDP